MAGKPDMRDEVCRSSTWWRRLATALIVVFGVIAIVGSGGGEVLGSAGGPIGPFPPGPSIDPDKVTVQVGAMVTLNATAGGTAPSTYQWRRNGVDIAGATDFAYTLAGANLSDDGVQFSVKVTNSVGVGTASSLLRVSSMPGVVYQDGEFAQSDWAVSAITDPFASGATHAESQPAMGGIPGALRVIAYQVPQGPNSIHLFHTARSATYDPAVQGAIYTLDLALDCYGLNTSTSGEVSALPAFEQAGRWFAPRQVPNLCSGAAWKTTRPSSLLADDFEQVSGPACGIAQSCPDFSASAPALNFGFVSSVNVPAASAAGTVTQGIDNWKVAVWRR